jgi:hypothetical protein
VLSLVLAMGNDLDTLFAFLAAIREDADLRSQLNEVCTADEVAAIAAQRGQPFAPAVLLDLFARCNEAPIARSGLMDEKLIRVLLQRDALLGS